MCPRRKFGIPETDLQESNTEVLPFKANAYYPAFYRNNQKVGTSGYLRIMWLRKIWEEGTFAILKGEHKRNKMPSKSNRGMPLIGNYIKSQKTGKSGVKTEFTSRSIPL